MQAYVVSKIFHFFSTQTLKAKLESCPGGSSCTVHTSSPHRLAMSGSSSCLQGAQRLERERPSCSSGWRGVGEGEHTTSYKCEREESLTKEPQISQLPPKPRRRGREGERRGRERGEREEREGEREGGREGGEGGREGERERGRQEREGEGGRGREGEAGEREERGRERERETDENRSNSKSSGQSYL